MYPFGEEWYSVSRVSRFKFTGYQRDVESGNDYAIFRHHVPRLGRFSSPDPLHGSVDDPQSLNRFAYVRNDPINFIDPLGLEPCPPGYTHIATRVIVPASDSPVSTVEVTTHYYCRPMGKGGDLRGSGGDPPQGCFRGTWLGFDVIICPVGTRIGAEREHWSEQYWRDRNDSTVGPRLGSKKEAPGKPVEMDAGEYAMRYVTRYLPCWATVGTSLWWGDEEKATVTAVVHAAPISMAAAGNLKSAFVAAGVMAIYDFSNAMALRQYCTQVAYGGR
jgi:RHS repeat-associated protein